jgi:exosortase/archaeosortase family protein
MSRAILVATAIPLAFFTNLLRITGTGVLAHYFGRTVAKGFLHQFSGFAILIVGLILMMLIWKVLTSSESRLKYK